MTVSSLIWALIAAMGVLDYVLLSMQGMTVVGQWPVVGFVFAVLVLSLLLQRFISSVARLIGAIAQILAFIQVGGFLTYAGMAASPFPLADALIARADAAVGFDWVTWYHWVTNRPMLHYGLEKAYASIPWQLAGLLLLYTYIDIKRIDELMLATILSFAFLIPVMMLLPALGPESFFGLDVVRPWRDPILALRAHTLLTMSKTEGIVTCPSFHTILAVLFINMARGGKAFLPVLALNVVMIVSVLADGGHYGMDVLTGVAAAWASIAAARSITKCATRASRVAGASGAAPMRSPTPV